MKKALFILTLLIISLIGHGQTEREQEIINIEEQLNQATSDTARVRIMCLISIRARDFDPEKSIKYSHEALELAQTTGDNYSIAKALNEVSANFTYHGEYDKGILYGKKALELINADTVNIKNNSHKINRQLGHIYNNIGMGYDFKSDFAPAIRYYLKSIDLFKRTQYIDGLAVCYNNLGISYLYTNDLDKSESYFRKTFDIYIAQNDTATAYQSKMNLGIIEYYRGDLRGAIEVYMEVEKIMEQLGNLRSLGHCQTNIGQTYVELEIYDSALIYVNKGLEIDFTLDDQEGLSANYRILGDIYTKMGNEKEAQKYLEKGLIIALKVGRKVAIRDSYLQLYETAKSSNNYKNALENYVLYDAYSDSIKTESSSTELGKIEAENEFNKEIAIKDAENKQKLKIEEEKRFQQSIILYFTIAILVVILFFVYMVWKSLKLVRQQKELVQEAKLEIEEKNQELVDSITYAKRIQSAILPPTSEFSKHLSQSFVLYKPKDIVAGDFYWLEPTNKGVLFAAADCTGHGVPGAMVSVLCNGALNRSVREFGNTDPGEILNKARDIVIQEFEKSEEDVKDGMDIALCSLSALRPASQLGKEPQGTAILKYAGAHNPLWIIRKGAQQIEEIKANKQPIGKFDKPQPYTTHTIELYEGDTFYIFSDGFSDQFGGEKGKKFKASNFKKVLLSIQNEALGKQKEILDNSFESWKGELEQLDDVCVIGVRV